MVLVLVVSVGLEAKPNRGLIGGQPAPTEDGEPEIVAGALRG